MSTHANRVKMTVASVGADPYTITLDAASSGYRSFATAYGANATVDVLITMGTTWEIARNCTYTHSGTTLSRGTLESSSTGSRITTFDNTAVVSVIATAAFGNNAEMAIQAVTPGGRLTTESGVPVSTSDRTAQSTLYYTPYIHNIINLWDGSQWKPIAFTEHTVTGGTLSGLTSGKPYDVFAYLSSGALATELLVWTNDTTRATAVTLQDGRYCKSGDKTRLLIGTIYTTGTTTTEDSEAKRLVSNVYNRVNKSIVYQSGAASHANSSSTRVAWNSSTASRLIFVSPVPVSVTSCMQCDMTAATALRGRIELELNGLTGATSAVAIALTTSVIQQACGSTFNAPAGYNYLHATELALGGTSVTFDYLVMTGVVPC